MKKLILAPLRGITNSTFRRIYHKHFPYFDYAVAPFVAPSLAQSSSGGFYKDLLQEENKNSILLEPQILLNNPAAFYPFLDKIHELGYSKININMGCPAAVVVKKKKGAALLENIGLTEEILKKISGDERFEFSVKLRLGMTEKRRIFEILPIIQKYKPSEIIIHPRTADMQYLGEANLEIFQELSEFFSCNTVYNGDVFSFAKYKKINSLFGDKISGIMLGRGVLVNPFLSQIIKSGEYPQKAKEGVYCFVEELYNEYKEGYFGEKPVLGKMKELWKYLRFSFDNSAKFIKKILKSESLYSYEKHFALLFENCDFDCNKEILTNIKPDEFS